MKFRIHFEHTDGTEDSFDVSGETLEDYPKRDAPNLDKTPGGKGECVGCQKRTEYCCPFCKVKAGKVRWVCESPECREKHEQIGCVRTPSKRTVHQNS